MRTKLACLTSVAALCALPSAAWAQDATTPPSAPAPAPGPVSEPGGAASAGTEAPAAEAEAPAGPTPMPGWIRLDTDGYGVGFWGGGTYPLADGIGLAFDIYASSFPNIGEIDVGPAITAGPVLVTPMLGMSFDWSNKKAAALVPQLFVVGGTGPIYGELWVQYFMNKVFDGASNQLYVRFFPDYKINDYFAVGPQLELTHDSEAGEIISMPLGANVMVSNSGVGGVLFAFLGYETKEAARQFAVTDDAGMPTVEERGLVGRLSFVKNF
jgi:hypothetical protein